MEVTVTQESGAAAAGRARATADRLAQLQARLDRLKRGEPATREDVQRAQQQARAQARALVVARQRLVRMHRSAAARHEEHAAQLAGAGRDDSAERQRDAARRGHLTIERILAARSAESTSGQVTPQPRDAPTGTASPPHSPHGADEEIIRLRHGLASLLSWAGEADLDEAVRRQTWCRSIVEQCVEPEWRSWIHAVCLAGADALAGVRGVAITVGGTDAEILAASDSWTARVQELELIVGEGPAATAYADERVVAVHDLTAERTRWQGYASASSDCEVRGICALPLHVREICVGSLTLYYHRPLAEHDPAGLADATAFADIAAAALLADIEQVRQGSPTDQGLFDVHVAAGVMAARLNIAPDEAWSRLRAYTFATGMGLVDVAQQVLEGEIGLP